MPSARVCPGPGRRVLRHPPPGRRGRDDCLSGSSASGRARHPVSASSRLAAAADPVWLHLPSGRRAWGPANHARPEWGVPVAAAKGSRPGHAAAAPATAAATGLTRSPGPSRARRGPFGRRVEDGLERYSPADLAVLRTPTVWRLGEDLVASRHRVPPWALQIAAWPSVASGRQDAGSRAGGDRRPDVNGDRFEPRGRNRALSRALRRRRLGHLCRPRPTGARGGDAAVHASSRQREPRSGETRPRGERRAAPTTAAAWPRCWSARLS